ncbi:hypothetical protein FHR47_002266 [Xanthomonas arboricola]|uniref:hypothetical protein n=1 Tax=Xanthomonas cannabis TaxID=1885674 RepID=UPI001615E7DA|nr:hypothetical protein [Xanthomonas cannabis]MBB3802018.1 hypothetical protein [Xanthomonas cannabis]
MEPKTRRKHLHASVTAATAYGMAAGMWIGFRVGEAGWIECVAFTLALMIVRVMVMSRIDAKYKYED